MIEDLFDIGGNNGFFSRAWSGLKSFFAEGVVEVAQAKAEDKIAAKVEKSKNKNLGYYIAGGAAVVLGIGLCVKLYKKHKANAHQQELQKLRAEGAVVQLPLNENALVHTQNETLPLQAHAADMARPPERKFADQQMSPASHQDAVRQRQAATPANQRGG